MDMAPEREEDLQKSSKEVSKSPLEDVLPSHPPPTPSDDAKSKKKRSSTTAQQLARTTSSSALEWNLSFLPKTTTTGGRGHNALLRKGLFFPQFFQSRERERERERER